MSLTQLRVLYSILDAGVMLGIVLFVCGVPGMVCCIVCMEEEEQNGGHCVSVACKL